MKKTLFLGVIALLTMSCGSSKSALETQNQLLMMQMQQQQQQQQQYAEQRPGRTMRATNPCMEMAQTESENLRAYGLAVAYTEKAALNEAERDAKNRMAAMIKTAVEGAAQDYTKNVNINLDVTTESIGEVVMSQYVVQEVANTKVIKTSVFDLTDGSIEVYVCIEMKKPQEKVEEAISNVLAEEEIIKVEYDRERFISKMSEGLSEYKKSLSQE